MKVLLLLAFYFFFQGEVPYKSSDDFKVHVDLRFIPRRADYKPNSYTGFGDRIDRAKSGAEPFLDVNVTDLKIQAEEIKMRAVDSNGKTIFKRKCSPSDIHFEMGYLNDLKNGEAASQITIFFFSSAKKEVSKIAFAVLPDGTFQVNGKWHGKF